MTADSCEKIDYLDDFEIINFESEEALNKLFASSVCVRSENRIDDKCINKVWKTHRKAANRTIDVKTQRCVSSEDSRMSK